jgi:PKD repeat protein
VSFKRPWARVAARAAALLLAGAAAFVITNGGSAASARPSRGTVQVHGSSSASTAVAAKAPPTSRAPASITDATTGLSDAANVAPVAACAPSTPVSATCLAQILGVRGTRAFVHPRLRKPSSIYRFTPPRPRQGHASTPAVAAAAAPQPGTPAYLQQAYDLAYLSQTAGTGETVAIVDAFDDPNAESDLAAYRSEFGLPACTSANGCFHKYDQTGGTNYPTTVDSGWELEISLDLDAVSALCPNCQIDLIEANSAGVSDLAAAQLKADQLGASVISDSWDLSLSTGQVSSFLSSGDYTFPGITTVAASGDSGYPGASTSDFPAALTGVTAAGGTTLEPASSSGAQSVRGFTESAWSGAGSGCYQRKGVIKPSYQSDTGCAGRSYTDISADADPNTGTQVYDSSGGGWVVVGGTSEASPLIAAYYALLGSTAQGPAWAYANASLLNDPSSGSNGACAVSISYICNAGVGYDGPTGVGSISGAAAPAPGAPGIAGPGTSGSYAQSVTANTAALQGGVYPNRADTTYWWEYGTTTAYGQQTVPKDIGSGSTPVQVADSLIGLSPGTTYHYRLVAQNSFGTEYGYDYTFTTSDPIALFTASPPVSTPGGLADFDASSSTDSAGTITDYRWNFGDGTADDAGGTPTVSHSYSARGTYAVTLTVTDSAGETNSSTQTITVDKPPTAAFTPSTTVATPGTQLSFNGTQSAPGAGGTITDYKWTFGDGTTDDTGTTPTTTHTYGNPGAYNVTLTTTDDLGVSSTGTQVLTVDAPPTASFTAPSTPLTPGSSATFDTSASSDAFGTITGYSWNFGDRSNGTGPDPTHTYTSSGTYTVLLTVTNNAGQTATSSQVVTVEAPPVVPPSPAPTPAPEPAASPTPAPSPRAAPAPTTPGPPAVTERVTVVGNQTRASVTKHGLRLNLSLSVSGRASFQITIPRAPGRAGDGKRGAKPAPITLMRVRDRAIASGTRVVGLPLSRAAARQLGGRGTVVVTVHITITDAYGGVITQSVSITLHR